MIESKDLVVIGVEDYHLKAAEFFSKKRILFEYPRRGYNYDPAKHHLNLVSGYLGEFAFLEFITQFLKDKYGKLKGLERYTTLANLDFSYQLIVGKTDEGFDFKKGEYEIDIKTYGTSFLFKEGKNYFCYLRAGVKRNLFDLNLFVDSDQAKKYKGNDKIIFVQAFIEGKDRDKNNDIFNIKNVILAGFHVGLPSSYSENIPNPAYRCSVKNLLPMSQIFEQLGF